MLGKQKRNKNLTRKKGGKRLQIALVLKIEIKSNKSPSNVDSFFPQQDFEVHRP